MQMDEQILAEGCSQGDNASRKELYERYAGRLLGLCLRYTGDHASAEDLLHDAFLKIFGAINRFSYRGPGSLRAWLERLVVNMAIEWLRTKQRVGMYRLDERLPVPDETSPDADEVERIPQQVLMRLVGELPDGYRTVFNLFCIEGHSHREIGQMLGIGEKSSSSQLTRAKAMLAHKIGVYQKKQGLYGTK